MVVMYYNIMKERSRAMLSTSDNPYNPWTQFDSWYNWDQMMGYNLSGYLARFTNNLSGMSEEDEALLNQEAKLT